jgi:hypothetical protein
MFFFYFFYCRELPGLRNGRLRREVSGELNFFYLRTFTNVLFLFFYYRELPGLRNGRLRQEVSGELDFFY